MYDIMLFQSNLRHFGQSHPHVVSVPGEVSIQGRGPGALDGLRLSRGAFGGSAGGSAKETDGGLGD